MQEAGIQPKKGLAQHFLVAQEALRKIIAAGELSFDDVVVEVGPGLGALTGELLRRAGQVVAVELDEKLCAFLQQRFQEAGNLTVVHQDVLAFSPRDFVGNRPYKVIANLPYYLAAAAVRHFLEALPQPGLLVVTIQKEVAQGMVARPGAMSILSVGVQFYGSPKIVAVLSPQSFYPAPKVESAVVTIRVLPKPAIDVEDPGHFFAVVKAGFSAPRKQLRNALAQGLGLNTGTASDLLRTASLDATRRAETLALEEWGRLYRVVVQHAPDALRRGRTVP
jgi:16S rRNA (adenine1518-N6/adenine1519-N6)-dimethyltransferase